MRPSIRGFTLVEVLVALVVLTIGMLGIAALYLESVRANRTALYRTDAVNLAADMADRMRANRDPADAYDCGEPCLAANGGNGQAVTDLTAWLAAVTQLPGGTGAIAYTAATPTTPDVYTIQVSWTEVGQDQAVTYELRAEL
ncbi:MAG TPA: type IV pilus modification protein PilV [Steroidobacteraceae bacterium]|nr:type IV pilus modification protein PilV [Steroidobacteraceae bacterium]